MLSCIVPDVYTGFFVTSRATSLRQEFCLYKRYLLKSNKSSHGKSFHILPMTLHLDC